MNEINNKSWLFTSLVLSFLGAGLFIVAKVWVVELTLLFPEQWMVGATALAGVVLSVVGLLMLGNWVSEPMTISEVRSALLEKEQC